MKSIKVPRGSKVINDKNKLFSSLSFTNINYILFGVSLVVIFFGYILMYTGDTNSMQSIRISPIILVIGYCILLPISIMYRSKE